MKKVLTSAWAMLMAFLLILLANYATAQPVKKTVPKRSAISDCRNMCGRYPNGNDQDGAVTSDFIQKMTQAYIRDKGKRMINGGGDNDALSVVFDLEKLKSFIWRVENAACTSGCGGKRMLGIRFYYIKYDVSAVTGHERELIENNADKHSLVMVPAYVGLDNEWYDFDLRAMTDSCYFPPPAVNKKSIGAGVIAIDGTNHGGLAPPPGDGIYPIIQH